MSLSRRQFLKTTAAGIGLGLLPGRLAWPAEESFSFGLVTDVHYADAATAGSRHYRDSHEKLRLAVETFNRRKLPFVVELGDFVDAGPNKADDLEYLRSIRGVFEAFRGHRHYVLGNHCVARLTKEEFLANCGTTAKKSYYSFDHGPCHLVVLDGNFKKDGSPYAAGNFSWTDTWIPDAQLRWLADDLKRASGRHVIVLIHQNLDCEDDAHGVKNAPRVREILEKAGNVRAVFQGHKHTGGYRKIGGIHYCTLRAMVEEPTTQNNAYAIVTVNASGQIALEGFGRQKDVAPQ